MVDCESAPPGLANLVPDLDILKTPSSPALALVGGTPVDIERPRTASSAAASLATGIVHGLFVPGNTVAVEVVPYWLVPHTLTSQQVESTRQWSFLRDLSLSFASAPGADPAKPASVPAGSTTATDAPGNTAALMSLGARTTIWPGRPSTIAQACMARILDFMKGDVALRNVDEAVFKATWTKANPHPRRKEVPRPADDAPDAAFDQWRKDMIAANADNDATDQEYAQRYTAALAGWEKDWLAVHGVPEDVAACTRVIDHRVGFVASAAVAALVSAPGGDFSRFHQGGTYGGTAWLTAGWSWLIGTATPWSFSGLGALRLRRQAIVDTTMRLDAVDYGVRAVAALGRWGVSLQAMRLGSGATGFGSGAGWQGGAAIDYHLKSGYWLTATAGSADLGDVRSWSNLTALVHLQYNVSRDRLIATDTSTVVATPGEGP